MGHLRVAAAFVIVVFLAPGAFADSVDFDLYGSAALGWGFTSGSMTTPGPNITVDEGDDVTIHLHSADSLPHKFFIDYDGDGIPDGSEPQSGFFTGDEDLTFTADVDGTFDYICSVHPLTMFGMWVTNAGPGPIHDVAVVSVAANPMTVNQGDPVTVTAQVANQGEAPETTTVTAFAGSLTIGTQSLTIPVGGTQTATFTWDTTGVPTGNYLIRAQASTVPGETDVADNELNDGTVTVQAGGEIPGSMAADLTRKSAWPARHHMDLSDGSIQTLYGLIANTGPGITTARVVFTITDRDTGAFVATVESNVVNLPADGMAQVSGTWDAYAGRFAVSAQCVFDTNGNGTLDGSSSDVKTFGFAVVP